MKILNQIKKLIGEGCVIFSLTTLIFYSIGSLLSNSEKAFIPSIKFIWLFFIFSVLLAAANEILSVKRFNIALRVLIHFVTCTALYFVTVVLCGGFISSGAQTLIALAAFVALYLVCAVFIVIFLARNEKRVTEKKEYVSQFK